MSVRSCCCCTQCERGPSDGMCHHFLQDRIAFKSAKVCATVAVALTGSRVVSGGISSIGTTNNHVQPTSVNAQPLLFHSLTERAMYWDEAHRT